MSKDSGINFEIKYKYGSKKTDINDSVYGALKNKN
jgi:hypothetical protein